MIMGICGAIIAFAFLLFYLVASNISRPIKLMTETMGVLANGDTSVEILDREQG